MISDHVKSASYAAPQISSRPRPRGVLEHVRHALRAWLGLEVQQVHAVPLQTVDKEYIAEPAKDEPWPSLNVVYDETKDLIADQNDRLKGIDTKANFGLAAATLLTAGVTGLGNALGEVNQQAVAPRILTTIGSWQITVDAVVGLVTVVSLLMYAAIAFTTYQGYRIRSFNDIKNAGKLMDTYLYESPEHTKAVLAGQRANNYTLNEAKLEEKAGWVEWSMKLLILEAALLVVIAFIQVVWL